MTERVKRVREREKTLMHLSFINMIMAPPQHTHTHTHFSTAEERQPEVSRRSLFCISSTIQTSPPKGSSVPQGAHTHTHTHILYELALVVSLFRLIRA